MHGRFFFSNMSGFGQIWRIYHDVPINYGTLKRNLMITHETLRCLFADKLIAGDSCWNLIIPNMEANYFEPQPFQCEDDSYLNRLSRSCVYINNKYRSVSPIYWYRPPWKHSFGVGTVLLESPQVVCLLWRHQITDQEHLSALSPSAPSMACAQPSMTCWSVG